MAIFNRNQERAEAAVAAIRQAGDVAHAFSADIAQSESVDAAFSRALEQLQRVDVLVNNAGLTRDGLFMRMSDEQWDQVISTNLGGAFRDETTRQRAGCKTRGRAGDGYESVKHTTCR